MNFPGEPHYYPFSDEEVLRWLKLCEASHQERWKNAKEPPRPTAFRAAYELIERLLKKPKNIDERRKRAHLKSQEIIKTWMIEDCNERREVAEAMKGHFKLNIRIAEALLEAEGGEK